MAHAATTRPKARTPAKRTLAAKKPVVKKTAAKKPVRKASAKAGRPPADPGVTIKGHENVFHALDRNNSGYVSRDEWPGSKMAFDAVDKNDDGRISLNELRARED